MPSPAAPPPLLTAPSSSPGHGQSSMATQPYEAVQGDHDDNEAGDHQRTTELERDHATSAVKSLLLKKRLTGANVRLTMFNALLKSLRDWNLEHKLFSITLDNATNNDKMVDHLKKNFLGRGLIVCNGDLLHMRCAAHVLNLIVQDGFKVIGNAITRIRDSVKYIGSSQGRKERFEEIIVQVGISCNKRPSLDIPSRWNSTYLMLLAAMEYRAAFDELYLQDPNFVDRPFDSDWEMAAKLCKIFKPFYESTNVVSGSLYPTTNLYFHELWKIKEKIEHEALNQDTSIAAMAVEMQGKFQKYWDLGFLQICIPIILDPRFKLKFVSFRLRAGWGDKAGEYLGKVKKTIKDLFLAYSSAMPSSNSENTQSRTDNQLVVDEDNPWTDFEQLLVAQKKNKMKSELDQYLQDDLFPRQKDFDILKWWMMHLTKYPILSRMAQDVLAAPATSVASESAFSTGERTISEYRSRLTSNTVEALICLQDWLRAQGRADVNIVDIVNTDDILEENS